MVIHEETVTFRNKPLRSLSREEAIEALLQALETIAELQGDQFIREPDSAFAKLRRE